MRLNIRNDKGNMKKISIFAVFILCFNALVAQNKEKYSLEVGSNVVLSRHISHTGFNKVLNKYHYPNFSKQTLIGGETRLTFRINRWGILTNMGFYGVQTPLNANKHYYSGEIETSSLGVSYDVVQKEIFTLSPFFAFGSKSTEMYLDYELSEGVTPTVLQIKGQESTALVGVRSYFRVSSWNDGRWQFFINVEGAYTSAMAGKWRFNNMLVSTKDHFSSVDFSVGVTFRYQF